MFGELLMRKFANYSQKNLKDSLRYWFVVIFWISEKYGKTVSCNSSLIPFNSTSVAVRIHTKALFLLQKV